MALLTQSETGHDPTEITSRRSMVLRPDIQKKYVPMQQMLRRDVFL